MGPPLTRHNGAILRLRIADPRVSDRSGNKLLVASTHRPTTLRSGNSIGGNQREGIVVTDYSSDLKGSCRYTGVVNIRESPREFPVAFSSRSRPFDQRAIGSTLTRGSSSPFRKLPPSRHVPDAFPESVIHPCTLTSCDSRRSRERDCVLVAVKLIARAVNNRP